MSDSGKSEGAPGRCRLSNDIFLLQRLGLALNRPVPQAAMHITDGITIRDFPISSLLRVRSKVRGLVSLNLNRAQPEFSRTGTNRNIVLKARQMGISARRWRKLAASK